MNELFIDTGVNTGWALFRGSIWPITNTINCPARMKKTLENYIRHSTANFSDLLLRFTDISKVTIEHPEYWIGSQKSKTAMESGSLLHLAMNCYAYSAICADRNIPFELITAKEWKGNLTKEATAYRVKLINGLTYDNDHITDAVGMGLSRDKNLWLLRKQKRN